MIPTPNGAVSCASTERLHHADRVKATFCDYGPKHVDGRLFARLADFVSRWHLLCLLTNMFESLSDQSVFDKLPLTNQQRAELYKAIITQRMDSLHVEQNGGMNFEACADCPASAETHQKVPAQPQKMLEDLCHHDQADSEIQ